MDNVDFEENQNPTHINIAEHTFEYMRVTGSTAIPFADLMGLRDAHIAIHQETDRLILDLSTYVLSDHLEPTTISDTKTATFKCPTTWWDMFKHHHLPWHWTIVKKLFKPAKFDTFEREVKLEVEVVPIDIYPEARVPMPSVMGRPFRTYTTEVLQDD